MSTSRLVSDMRDDVAIIHFKDAAISDAQIIACVAAELSEMVERRGVQKMVLDMNNVQFIATLVFATFISLVKTLRMKNGDLKLCRVRPPIFRVFEMTCLDKVFGIYSSEAEALDAFQSGNRTPLAPGSSLST